MGAAALAAAGGGNTRPGNRQPCTRGSRQKCHPVGGTWPSTAKLHPHCHSQAAAAAMAVPAAKGVSAAAAMAGRGSICRSRGRSHCTAPSYTWPPCQRTRSAHAGKTLGFCRRTGATATGVVERCAASVIVRVTAPKGWAAEARPRSEAKPCSGWRPRPGTVRPCPEASKRLEARSRPGARARLEGRARSVTRPCLEARARPDSTPRGAEQQLEADLLLRGYLCHFAACNTGGLKTGSYARRTQKMGLIQIQ